MQYTKIPALYTYMEEDDDNVCYGTDTIVTYAAVNLVRENASAEVRYMMSCITFPCMYDRHNHVYLTDHPAYSAGYPVLFSSHLPQVPNSMVSSAVSVHPAQQ